MKNTVFAIALLLVGCVPAPAPVVDDAAPAAPSASAVLDPPCCVQSAAPSASTPVPVPSASLSVTVTGTKPAPSAVPAKKK